MSWSCSNSEPLSKEAAAKFIQDHEVQSDNKAQEFGHVDEIKDLALGQLDNLPSAAKVRFSIGGHTDSKEVWQGYCNLQFSTGY